MLKCRFIGPFPTNFFIINKMSQPNKQFSWIIENHNANKPLTYFLLVSFFQSIILLITVRIWLLHIFGQLKKLWPSVSLLSFSNSLCSLSLLSFMTHIRCYFFPFSMFFPRSSFFFLVFLSEWAFCSVTPESITET